MKSGEAAEMKDTKFRVLVLLLIGMIVGAVVMGAFDYWQMSRATRLHGFIYKNVVYTLEVNPRQ